MKYDALIVGSLVVSYGKTSAFCGETYKPYFICSVCKGRVEDKVVTIMARREHVVLHPACADKMSLAVEQALIAMDYNFIDGVADGQPE